MLLILLLFYVRLHYYANGAMLQWSIHFTIINNFQFSNLADYHFVIQINQFTLITILKYYLAR